VCETDSTSLFVDYESTAGCDRKTSLLKSKWGLERRKGILVSSLVVF